MLHKYVYFQCVCSFVGNMSGKRHKNPEDNFGSLIDFGINRPKTDIASRRQRSFLEKDDDGKGTPSPRKSRKAATAVDTSNARRRKRSLSQGSSPIRKMTISPGTRRRLLARQKSSPNIEDPPPSRKSTLDRILLFQELGKDVPIEIGIKRVLLCSQRNDWTGCEQAIR